MVDLKYDDENDNDDVVGTRTGEMCWQCGGGLATKMTRTAFIMGGGGYSW